MGGQVPTGSMSPQARINYTFFDAPRRGRYDCGPMDVADLACFSSAGRPAKQSAPHGGALSHSWVRPGLPQNLISSLRERGHSTTASTIPPVPLPPSTVLRTGFDRLRAGSARRGVIKPRTGDMPVSPTMGVPPAKGLCPLRQAQGRLSALPGRRPRRRGPGSGPGGEILRFAQDDVCGEPTIRCLTVARARGGKILRFAQDDSCGQTGSGARPLPLTSILSLQGRGGEISRP